MLVLAISIANSQGERDGAELNNGNYDIKGVSASRPCTWNLCRKYVGVKTPFEYATLRTLAPTGSVENLYMTLCIAARVLCGPKASA